MKANENDHIVSTHIIEIIKMIQTLYNGKDYKNLQLGKRLVPFLGDDEIAITRDAIETIFDNQKYLHTEPVRKIVNLNKNLESTIFYSS